MKKRIEEITECNSLWDIKGVKIDGQNYALKISNDNKNYEGKLCLDFFSNREEQDSEYSITIDEKGIRFERYVHRPNHDHDDVEKLQLVTNSKKAIGLKKGEIFWNSRGPYPSEGVDYFYIPFGAITITMED